MRKEIAIALVVVALPVFAEWNPLETTDQARQRQSAQNYETYRNRGNSTPLGGYDQPLGAPASRGVERPGYQPPSPASPPPSYGAQDWRDAAKGRRYP